MQYKTLIDGKEWAFASKSTPGKEYTVKLNDGNVKNREQRKNLSCNCPAWIYKNKNGNRWCKHCDTILKKELTFTKQLDVMERRNSIYGDHGIDFAET